MGHYDCKSCDAAPYEEHSHDCERYGTKPTPTKGTDMIEKVARAMCRADPEVRSGDADGVVEQRVNIEWVHYVDQAKAAIAAMPVQAAPVAWLYVRRADAWPPAPPRVSLTRWPEDGATRDYWDEHALGIIPTPPNGGSDAE